MQQLLASGQQLVICNASYLYFDMPYRLHPEEPGLPWAAYLPSRRIYDFDPLAAWQIPPAKQQQVLGLQAQLWSETIYTPALMDYHLFPRTLAFAERCWNKSPAHTSIDNGWNQFATALGKRELPYLHSLGIAFRVPPPAIHRQGGQLQASVAYPGLEVAFTTDGTAPSQSSARLAPGQRTTEQPNMKLAAIEPISKAISRLVQTRR